jgi:hypothetical protein
VARSVSSLYLMKKVIQRNRNASAAVLLVIITLGFGAISGHFYRAASSAQQEARTMSAISASNYRADETWALLALLQAWDANEPGEARRAFQCMNPNSREAKSVRYLTDANAPEAKETGFRADMSTGSEWFADFVVAEDRLRRGRRDQAVEYYLRSWKAIDDKKTTDPLSPELLIRDWIGRRLYETATAGGLARKGDEAPEPQTGNERKGR